MRQFFNAISSNTEGSTKKKVFIIAGQSNTAGRATNLADLDFLEADNSVPGVMMYDYRVNEFRPMKYGDNVGDFEDWDSLKFSYDSTALYNISQYLGEDVYAIKLAVGGTAIGLDPVSIRGSWNVNYALVEQQGVVGDLVLLRTLNDFIIDAMKTINNAELTAILWHQGESDAFSPINTSNYEVNFNDVVDRLRGLTVDVLPLLYGTVIDFDDIADIQLDYVNASSNNYCRDMRGETTIDGVHFDGPAYKRLGVFMFEQLRDNGFLN